MWMIDPKYLCDKHLLGEHGELHKFRPSFIRQYSIAGRVTGKIQIEPIAMESRHNILAEEMLRRGMNHKSPYAQPDITYLPQAYAMARVDPLVSAQDLKERCELCKAKLEAAGL